MASEFEPFVAAVGIDNQSNYLNLSHDISPLRFGELGDFAVGILMSEKTGLIGIPNRHGAVYPDFNATNDIVSAHRDSARDTLPPIVHYNTDHPELVGHQLVRALSPLPDVVFGVQINGLKPDHISGLARVRDTYAGTGLVVQIHTDMLREYTPDELARLIASHQGVVDGVWLDDSGGLGKQLNPNHLLPYINALSAAGVDIIGFGGGLNANNVTDLVEPVVQEFPFVSWDAQSGVQSANPDGTKEFKLEQAREFLLASASLRAAYSLR